MNCELTPHGRDVLADVVAPLRNSGSFLAPYEVEDETGLFLLGEGNHRYVFGQSRTADPPLLTDRDCVVKVAKYPERAENRMEIANWAVAPPELRQFLVPVTDAAEDGAWLVQPRVETGVDRSDFSAREWEMTRDTDWRLPDFRRGNSGYYQGEVRALDYGRPINEVGEGYLVGEPPEEP